MTTWSRLQEDLVTVGTDSLSTCCNLPIAKVLENLRSFYSMPIRLLLSNLRTHGVQYHNNYFYVILSQTNSFKDIFLSVHSNLYSLMRIQFGNLYFTMEIQ